MIKKIKNLYRGPAIDNRKSDKVDYVRNHWIKKSVCLLICGVFLLSTGLLSADIIADTIENTKTALEKWIETQKILSQEKRDHEIAKEMLRERIDLVQREIDSLREKLGEAKQSVSEADKKRAELMKDNDRLKEGSASLLEALVTFEKGTQQLIQLLPDLIRERIKPLSQRLPDKEGQSSLSIAERFQNVVGILNEVDKFNTTISVASEVRTLLDGTSAEVATLYVGIGQAYYSGVHGTIAGIGFVSDSGWIWLPANEAAEQISQAISILNNEQVASFVQLPVEIR